MKKYFALILIALLLSCREKPTDGNSPPAPTLNLKINSLFAINHSDAVTLSWTEPTGGTADSIEIHRSTRNLFVPAQSSRIGYAFPPHTSYNDTAVQIGGTYYYRAIPIGKDSSGKSSEGKASNIAIGKPYDYDAIGLIKYTEHIQRIFASSCAVHECHVGGNIFAHKHGEQFSLLSWDDVVKGGNNGAILIPYHAERSDLISHTNTDTTFGSVVLQSHMPSGNVSLPMNQVRIMARWINEGAKSEQGKMPYATSMSGKMYVVNASADLLAVIDVKDQLLVRYVNIASSFSPPTSFGSPHHVHIDPKGQYFYVSLIELGEIWQYSVDSNKYVAKVSDPLTMSSPADMAISPSGDTIFVSNYLTAGNNRRITVLKTTPSLHIIDVITMPFFCTTPHGLKRSHDGRRLYSTNTTSGNISEINTHDFSYINIIALDTSGSLQNTTYDPYLIDISKDDSLMFVACKGSDEVRVIDRRKDSTKATTIIPVGDTPLHLKLTPNEQEVWVCNQNSDNITIIRTSDFTTTTLEGVGRQPHGIEFTPDGQYAYITCENVANPDPPHHPVAGGKGVSFVIIYNVASRQKIRTIEVAGWSQGIEFAKASKN